MYVILEMQTNDGQTAIPTPIKTAETKNEAMSMYHGILCAAAISEVHCHTAMVIDEEGKVYARESYTHGADAPEIEVVE